MAEHNALVAGKAATRPIRRKPTLDTLQITTKKQALLDADVKMPGTPFGPGTLREFQFPE
jgi:hypothetical protein